MQVSDTENTRSIEFSPDQLAMWVGSQCMANLEDWGSAAELPAFSTMPLILSLTFTIT